MTYKVGDRVKTLESLPSGLCNIEGVIKKVVSRSIYPEVLYAVELDPPFMGSPCAGIIPSKRGYWLFHDELLFISGPDINIDKDIPKFSYGI